MSPVKVPAPAPTAAEPELEAEGLGANELFQRGLAQCAFRQAAWVEPAAEHAAHVFHLGAFGLVKSLAADFDLADLRHQRVRIGRQIVADSPDREAEDQ